MKKLEAILLNCCAFTVAIMLAFFTLASAFGSNVSLNFFNFFICLVIGSIIAVSTLIFKITSLASWIKVSIHFLILLAMYLPFLYISIPEFMEKQTSIFVAIMLYTIAYTIGFLIAFGLRKLLGKDTSSRSDVKKEYIPRYK